MFLISIHPRHVASILALTKTVECRKSAIGLSEGDLLVLYATAPIKAVQGEARVSTIHEGSPRDLWQSHSHRTGVTEAEFFSYYGDARRAVLLALSDVRTYSKPIPLSVLRETQPGFSPPQTARRLGEAFQGLPALGQ